MLSVTAPSGLLQKDASMVVAENWARQAVILSVLTCLLSKNFAFKIRVPVESPPQAGAKIILDGNYCREKLGYIYRVFVALLFSRS